MDPGPNEHVIEELRAGSPSAFEAVYRSEKARVYGLLLRLSGDSHMAADLFQNVWLKLVRNASRLRPDTNLRGWLVTVARNEFVSHKRAQALDLSRLLAIGLDAPVVSDATPARLTDLARALDELGEGGREVLLVTSVEGLTPEQAASALGVSDVALRQRLSRAGKRLSAALERISQDVATMPVKGADR